MSTVVVARKGRTVAIASDALVTFGETRLPAGYEANAKLFKAGGSWFGTVGSTAHTPVLQQALASLEPGQLRLDSREAIFDTFVALHPRLKERFFLNTKEHDNDPYESSQFSVLVANRHGIFGVESYREVFAFERHRLGPALRAGRDARRLGVGPRRARGGGRGRGGRLRVRHLLCRPRARADLHPDYLRQPPWL